ncbi:hypothetical protein Tco_0598793 [Tanacetum coccineum]
MESHVGALMKDAISIMKKSEDIFGISSKMMHPLPPEPSRQEAFKDLSIFSLCYLFHNLFSLTSMGDKNPIRTLRDYSKPSHEGYRNTIELPEGNNVLPLRHDTIRLVQNGCSFHGFWPEDPNQHLKDFLKLVDSLDLDVANRERTRMRESLSEAWTSFKNLLQKIPHHGIGRWLLIKIYYDHVSFHLKCEIDRAAVGKLRDKNTDESWEIIENLALYDQEG